MTGSSGRAGILQRTIRLQTNPRRAKKSTGRPGGPICRTDLVGAEGASRLARMGWCAMPRHTQLMWSLDDERLRRNLSKECVGQFRVSLRSWLLCERDPVPSDRPISASVRPRRQVDARRTLRRFQLDATTGFEDRLLWS